MSDSDLHAIIADQAETIDQLRAELSSVEQDLAETEVSASEDYYRHVYSDIRSAWDAWAFAELGTASPTPLDLEGRPELAALYEAVK